MLSHALRLRPCVACRALAPRALAQVRLGSDSAPRRRGGATDWPSERTRKKAVERARQMQALLAQQAQPTPSSSGSAPAPTADGGAPTVEDLLALQPEEDPRPKAADYAAQHAALCERLDRAFLRDQLLELCAQLGLPTRARQTKTALVQKILDTWGWVRPKKPEKVYAQEFPLSPATLFHLQRNLPANEWLERLPGTAVSVAAAEGGYVLAADGPRAALDALARFLHDFVNTLTVVPLPPADGELAPRTRWEVSQATGAWIDQRGITGPRPAAQRAEDMLARLGPATTAPVLLQRGGSFALVPHAPAAPLPWAAAAAVDGRGLFRLVGGEPEAEGEEDLAALRVLQAGEGRGPAPTLHELVGSSPLARFGHHLLPAASAEASLAPPLPAGELAPSSPLAALSGTVFSPAVPPALVRFPQAERPRRLRRLTYALGSDRLVATYAYPARAVEAAPAPAAPEPHWTQLLEAQLKASRASLAGRDEFDIDELDRLLRDDPEDEKDDLVDEILGASGRDIDALIASGGKAPAGQEPAEEAAQKEPPPKGDVREAPRARLERGAATTDVLLPWLPVDARFVTRALERAALPAELEDFFARVAEHGEYVAGLALDDVAGLRRGTPPPAAPEPELEAEVDALEALGQESDDSIIPPPPLGVQEDAGLAPPRQITVAGRTATLAADEVLDVTESVKPGLGPRPTLRAVSSIDLATPGGVLRYAELEGEGLWDELASVARPVPTL